jgi:UDP-N-acetylmuramoyl-L-alanyl-D-glutamate--2,6-diaminopimelate ligase
MTTSLSSIFFDFPLEIIKMPKLPDTQVKGVSFDSRKVKPGFIFVPLTGVGQDGHAYIPAAIQNGAIAVIGSDPAVQTHVPYIQVKDTRLALAFISAAFYGFPARKLTVIGVTGTDGKTTTCNLIFQILKAAGIKVGLISTVNAVIGDRELDTGFHVTTPDAPDVQHYLAEMVSAGLTHVVLEATSHGLAQDRVAACEFDIGVATNITHEHLDFHGSYENYFNAKGKLFSSLQQTKSKPQGNPRLAVLNYDDQSYAQLKDLTIVKQVSYSFNNPSSDVWVKNLFEDSSGMRFTVVGQKFELPIKTSLIGKYNVSNILAALCTTIYGLNVLPQIAAEGISNMTGVPGRMEKIDLGQDFTAIVDFAHTPNALSVTLKQARTMTHGRVISVFGSAGLRDREKRRMMADVSLKLADFTILTAEDPRTESLEDILAEMAEAAVNSGVVEGRTFWRIPDRGEAIRIAVQLAQSGDLVIACGKGHEQSMCFDETEYPWDDRTAMRAALAERLGIPGEKMPYLPTQDLDK